MSTQIGRPYPFNQCCPHFQDYYDPATWYFRPCSFVDPPAMGYANRTFAGDVHYFWDTLSLASTLNSALVSWQFIDPPFRLGTTQWAYVKTNIPLGFGPLNYTLKTTTGGFGALEATYTSRAVSISSPTMNIAISDVCVPPTGVSGNASAGLNSRRFVLKMHATITLDGYTLNNDNVSEFAEISDTSRPRLFHVPFNSTAYDQPTVMECRTFSATMVGTRDAAPGGPLAFFPMIRTTGDFPFNTAGGAKSHSTSPTC